MTTLTFTSVHEEAAGAGGFSSLLNLGGGIVLAGKWHWNAGNYPDDLLFRSYDFGATWANVGTITGATGKAVTGLASHGNVVLAVTGDKGDPCLLVSYDYGDTWAVLLSTAQLATLCTWTAGDLWSMSVVYTGNLWLVTVYNDATGQTKALIAAESAYELVFSYLYTLSSLTSLEVKRIYRMQDGSLMALWSGWGVYTSPQSETLPVTWTLVQACHPSALIKLASGTILVGTQESYNIGTKIFRAASITHGGVTTTTWSIVRGFPPLAGNLGCDQAIRAFAEPMPGQIYMWIGGCETDTTFHGCLGYKSVDDGLTWVSVGNPYTNLNGGMAGVYDTAYISDGVILLGCTPDANILTSSIPTGSAGCRTFFDAMLRLAHFLMPLEEGVVVGHFVIPDDTQGVVWDMDMKVATEVNTMLVVVGENEIRGLSDVDLAAGTQYAMSNADFSLGILRRAINEAMREYGQVRSEMLIATVEDQASYTAEADVKEVWFSTQTDITQTTEPWEWKQLFHWDENAGTLTFPTGFKPSGGYVLKVVYQDNCDQALNLSADTDEIPDGVDLDLIHWAAAVWIVENSGMPRFHGDPQRDLVNKAMKAEAELNKRLRNWHAWQRSARPADY